MRRRESRKEWMEANGRREEEENGTDEMGRGRGGKRLLAHNTSKRGMGEGTGRAWGRADAEDPHLLFVIIECKQLSG